MAQMNKKWVALCSAAITAVYAAGYFTTETEASSQSLPQHTQAVIPTNHHKVKNTLRSQSVYKDGTYTGTGNNRRGSIEVSVMIRNDKITDVEVSHYAMHYSESDITGLPSEVVKKQSAQVTNVSGATYSTLAFREAVQNALSSARRGSL